MQKITADDIQSMSMEQYAEFRQKMFTSDIVFVQEPGTNSYAYYRQKYINTGNENDLERMLGHVETDTTPGC